MGKRIFFLGREKRIETCGWMCLRQSLEQEDQIGRREKEKNKRENTGQTVNNEDAGRRFI